LIAAGTYALNIDGFRGAVLQMMAHGFVVVGLFFAAEIIYRRLDTRIISEMGGIRIQAPVFASMFMILVFASISLPSTFNFIGEFTVLYALFQINIWFAIFGGLTIILGAYYMLKLYQHSMLGETHTKIFKDVTFSEGLVMVLIIGIIMFFGLYPKPLTDLITPSLEVILQEINK
jgi:NADH-quinone oxidoreductase subunit M